MIEAADLFLSWSIWLALVILAAAFLLTVRRIIAGPTLADRVVGLDMLTGIVIGFIALIAIRTGFTLYIDIAIALGLVGFLSTVAFARFILSRSQAPRPGGEAGMALLSTTPVPRRKRSAKSVTGTGPAVRRKAKK